jgi:hypothetical protein
LRVSRERDLSWLAQASSRRVEPGRPQLALRSHPLGGAIDRHRIERQDVLAPFVTPPDGPARSSITCVSTPSQ